MINDVEPKRVFFFLPWCELQAAIVVDGVEFVPLGVDVAPDDAPEAEVAAIRGYLKPYRFPNGRPVREWTVVRRVGAGLVDFYTAEQREEIFDYVEIVKFAALAERAFGGLLNGNYVNSDTLTAIGQGIGRELTTTALMTKTATGHTMNIVAVSDLNISMPLHVWGSTTPTINIELAIALARRRESADWMSAVTAYNMANTDTDAIRPQMEWTLLGGVVDRLFPKAIKGDKRDVQAARAFEAALTPARAWEAYDDIEYRPLVPGESPRFTWMKELYGLRNEYAHGKRSHDRPTTHWSAQEHLFLAKLLLPLLVKQLMASDGAYLLSKSDQELLDLVDHVLLLQSRVRVGSNQHPLDRLRSAKFHDDMFRKMYAFMESRRGIESDDADDASDGEDGDGPAATGGEGGFETTTGNDES